MTDPKKKNVNININDGVAFFANETNIIYNPLQFLLDFKSLSPRIDQRVNEEQAAISLVHNVVMIDPYHALQLLNALHTSVDNYEKQFGKIEKPKALEKFEKDNKDFLKKMSKSSQEVPGYFG